MMKIRKMTHLSLTLSRPLLSRRLSRPLLSQMLHRSLLPQSRSALLNRRQWLIKQ